MTARARTRTVILGGLVLLLLLIGAVVWVGVRGSMAKAEIDRIAPLAADAQKAVDDSDVALAGAAFQQIAPHAALAASLTSDPIWRSFEWVPWVGPNLAAVRVSSESLDRVTTAAALPLLDALGSMGKSLRTDDGRIDVGLLNRLAAPLATADRTVGAATADLQSARSSDLLPQVGTAMERFSAMLDRLRPEVGLLAGFATLAPSMLGADGPRTILVAVQNSAELRTGGGITGSFMLFTADDGRMTLTAQADGSDFPPQDSPIAPVPAGDLALYGSVMGRFVQNTTMTADFTASAQFMTAWWKKHTGSEPDIIVALDPMLLEPLLSVMGPVETPAGSLTAENVMTKLLVEPYLTLDSGPAQDALFRSTAQAVITRLFAGGYDPVALMRALRPISEAGHLALWSRHPDEQRMLGGTVLGGPAARQALAGQDAYSVYFNDATGAKMDVFLHAAIAAGSAQCRTDGLRDVLVAVTLSSSAPPDAASLPFYLTGGGLNGVPAGDIATSITVAAPPGTFYSGVQVDGRTVLSANATASGYPSSVTQVSLHPGQSVTATFRFIAAEPGLVAPVLLHTPFLNDITTGEQNVSCR